MYQKRFIHHTDSQRCPYLTSLVALQKITNISVIDYAIDFHLFSFKWPVVLNAYKIFATVGKTVGFRFKNTLSSCTSIRALECSYYFCWVFLFLYSYICSVMLPLTASWREIKSPANTVICINKIGSSWTDAPRSSKTRFKSSPNNEVCFLEKGLELYKSG